MHGAILQHFRNMEFSKGTFQVKQTLLEKLGSGILLEESFQSVFLRFAIY